MEVAFAAEADLVASAFGLHVEDSCRHIEAGGLGFLELGMLGRSDVQVLEDALSFPAEVFGQGTWAGVDPVVQPWPF